VLFSGVLPYLEDEQVLRVLRYTHDALKPGGLLYMRNNCANKGRFEKKHSLGFSTVYRTGAAYRALVEQTPGFEVLEERYLFPPFCLPNLVYYHLLPEGWKEQKSIDDALDLWFELEQVTADIRLQLFSRLYPPLLRWIRKPTSFRVLLARKL
jgi:hypothetical protein